MGRFLIAHRLVVVDTSAIVAILQGETLADQLSIVLGYANGREMSAASFVEAGTVLAGRKPEEPRLAIRRLEQFVSGSGIVVVPHDAAQAFMALEARVRFGKGLGGPGKLNLGDTFAYALAKIRNAPLLFVGDDFSKTDVIPALV